MVGRTTHRWGKGAMDKGLEIRKMSSEDARQPATISP
jgi:hypothetical protein